MKRIITHSGPFHADDVMAVAVLELSLEEKEESYEVIRSRDAAVWPKGDFVVDVGGVYDPATHRYDHHQEGGAGQRENGTPYSSIGLVWKHHGRDLVSRNEVWDEIDRTLVQPLDLEDVGVEMPGSMLEGEIRQYSLDDMVHAFYPLEQDLSKFDERFTEVVQIFRTLLSHEIAAKEKEVREADIVRGRYREARDKRVIVLETYSSGKGILSEYAEPQYVVYPNAEKTGWRISGVQVNKNSFSVRKPFPAEWAGKRDDDLARVTKVPDANFCHNGRWIAGASSKEGAIAMAKKALEA